MNFSLQGVAKMIKANSVSIKSFFIKTTGVGISERTASRRFAAYRHPGFNLGVLYAV